MYTNLGAHVNSNGQLGSLFKITVGTRQGCNLSPTLFNLFINDLPLIIGKGDCDPVSLNNMKISMLMYADDTLSRLPLMFNIICAVCKYRIRLESYGEDDLLYHALKSQQKKSQNSYKYNEGTIRWLINY